MISETRTIFFEQDDLMAAVLGYPGLAKFAPPRGHLVAVVCDPAAIDRVVLRFITDAGADERVRSYAQAVEIMVAYCGAVGIPLPRRGQKHIAPNGDGAALVVRLSERSGDAFLSDMERIEAVSRRPGFLAAV